VSETRTRRERGLPAQEQPGGCRYALWVGPGWAYQGVLGEAQTESAKIKVPARSVHRPEHATPEPLRAHPWDLHERAHSGRPLVVPKFLDDRIRIADKGDLMDLARIDEIDMHCGMKHYSSSSPSEATIPTSNSPHISQREPSAAALTYLTKCITPSSRSTIRRRLNPG
jgi:hypothetical protein